MDEGSSYCDQNHRVRTGAGPRRSDPAGGFSLIEILISMVLLAVMLVSLAPVTMRVARLSTGSTVATQRAALLAGEAQRLELATFSSLTAGTTCYDFSSAEFPHSRCVRITDVDATTKRVTLTVAPTVGAPDSVTVEKAQGGRYNPLKP
jgi:prepilin-type N-terminal cleavage/methylation domain-containing protein